MGNIYKYRFGDILTINNIQYHIRLVSSMQEKVPRENDMLGLKIGIEVRKLSTNQILKWEDIKGTYLAEKINDFITNTIHGKRTIYLAFNDIEEKQIEIVKGEK